MTTANSTFATGRPGRSRHVQAAAFALYALVALGMFFGTGVSAQAQAGPTLDEISYSSLPGDRVQIRLKLSDAVKEPLTFAIDNPARVALDFAGVSVNLPRRTENVGVGMARSVTAVEAGGRTRVVLNLIKLVPYEMRIDGPFVYVTLDSPGVSVSQALAADARVSSGLATKGAIENVDFRRGAAGEARIIVTLSDPSVVVDTREEGGQILVEFVGATLPERLERRLDVVDFATPVTAVDTFSRGGDVRMVIAATGLYEHLAYQSDNLFTLEVKPLSREEQEAVKKEKFGYTGERLSLNFQNIEVRSVLQLIADFTGLNLVASDTVSGSLTLRLKNVPWDQALDIILKTKGLAMRQAGNVILVAPSEEIAAREKLELEAQRQIDELAPLRTEFVQVNYAKGADIANLLKAKENSLLSERGNVTVDERTNTLLVRDTADNLASVRELVSRLDIPVRQVLIESRIVFADSGFSKELGVRFGYSRRTSIQNGDNFLRFGGTQPRDVTSRVEPPPVAGPAVPDFATVLGDNLIVDLPVVDPAGSFGILVGKIGSSLINLELSALQEEGRGEVLANPRVITSNQKEAVIEQGTEIPFQEASSSGATSTSFKKAVLALRVTPQITPDDRVIMDLAVDQDTVGQEFSGIPSVDTRSVTTQVLVDNGETVVLGGIYEQDTRRDETKVPWFGDLPLVGFMFRNIEERDDKSELLIFVTPKILKDSLTLR